MIPAPLGIPPMEPYLSLLALLLPLHALSLRAVGLYEYRHERTKADEAFVVLQGATLATLLLVAGTFFFRTFSYSRWFMLVFWAFDVVAVFGVRLAIRDVVRALRRHGRFVRRALVVGAGELGQEVVRRLRGHPEFGVRVVGYLDDRIPVGERIEGKEVLGGCEAVTRVLADYRVDQIFLALPLEAHHEVLKVLNAIEGELVDVKMVPDVLQFVTLRAAVEELEGLPVISLAQSPIIGWARLLKRGTDLALAALGLVLLAPDPRADRPRDPADVAGVRLLPPGAHGARRALVRHRQVPHDARGRRGATRAPCGRAAATAGRPGSGGCSGASRSTSCPSSGTCSRGT